MQEEQARNHRYRLLDSNPKKGIISLAMPMIIAFLFQSGFNIVDTIFVGRLGYSAIAGVSLAFPFQMFIISISAGLGIGAQSLIARSIGRSRKEDADRAAGHVIVLALIFGAITTSIGLLISPALVSSLDASEDVVDNCLLYLTPILAGSVFIYLNMVMNSVFRGEGDTKRPMYFMAISAVMNIVLDPIFIFYLDYGVSGAAYATVLSRITAILIILYYILIKKSTYVSFVKDSFKLKIGTIKNIIDVGLPASLAQTAMSLSLFFLNDIVSPFGDEALAAFGVGFRVESLVFLPMIGFSNAFISAVGYFKGSGQPHKIKTIHTYTIKLLIMFMVFCSILFYTMPDIIYAIFTNEANVISIGEGYLRILALFYPIMPFSLMSAAGFQGIGKGYPSLVLALVRSGCVSVPMAYYFTVVAGGSIRYIWLAIAMGDLFSAVFGHIWFKIEQRKLENMATKNI
ncbi:MAG TPA: MATE family efflux transporter [Candidatus Methanofastidiosa archaeon]|nr:MATE family efflux transporter [Candidatus Methanofastidiosa archaeon]HPR41227.1 MATE family efflux transporter [Candidatus Methanofastidiosa archaeon]